MRDFHASVVGTQMQRGRSNPPDFDVGGSAGDLAEGAFFPWRLLRWYASRFVGGSRYCILVAFFDFD